MDLIGEEPHEGDWTLRASLVRYAQAEPVRAAALLHLLRRTEWARQQAGDDSQLDDSLRAASDELRALARDFARWASTTPLPRFPHERVDDAGGAIHRLLAAAGVPEQPGR